MLTALAIALLLLGATGIGAGLADTVWRRRVANDPLFSPPTDDVAQFADECRRHARVYMIGARSNGQRPALPLASARRDEASVLRLLGELNCVVPVRRGIAQLPGGLTADLGRGREIEEALAAAYVALGEAASVITREVTTTHRPEELINSESAVLRSIAGPGARYPMEDDIRRLAAILGVDPNRLDGPIQGERLWLAIHAWQMHDALAQRGAPPVAGIAHLEQLATEEHA